MVPAEEDSEAMTDLNGIVWTRWIGPPGDQQPQLEANRQELEAARTLPQVVGSKRMMGQGRNQRRKQLRWQGKQLRAFEAGDRLSNQHEDRDEPGPGRPQSRRLACFTGQVDQAGIEAEAVIDMEQDV